MQCCGRALKVGMHIKGVELRGQNKCVYLHFVIRGLEKCGVTLMRGKLSHHQPWSRQILNFTSTYKYVTAHIHSTLHVFCTSYLHIAIYTLYLLSIQTNKEPYYVIRDGKSSLVFSLSINRLDVEDDLSVEEMKKIVLTQSPRTQTPGGHTLFIILRSSYLEYGIYILLAF